jgi:phage gp36-like protein
MSNWISQTDYKAMVRDTHLAQIIDEDNTLLDNVELTAIQVVKDALHQWYDTTAIFGTSGANRPRQVLRWCIVLAVYYLYERVPDKLVPQRVTDNYTQAIDMLRDISDGKVSLDLPLRVNDEGENVVKFRWGSQPARGHDT